MRTRAQVKIIKCVTVFISLASLLRCIKSFDRVLSRWAKQVNVFNKQNIQDTLKCSETQNDRWEALDKSNDKAPARDNNKQSQIFVQNDVKRFLRWSRTFLCLNISSWSRNEWRVVHFRFLSSRENSFFKWDFSFHFATLFVCFFQMQSSMNLRGGKLSRDVAKLEQTSKSSRKEKCFLKAIPPLAAVRQLTLKTIAETAKSSLDSISCWPSDHRCCH